MNHFITYLSCGGVGSSKCGGDPRTPGHQGPRAPGPQDPKTLGALGSRTPGPQDPGTPTPAAAAPAAQALAVPALAAQVKTAWVCVVYLLRLVTFVLPKRPCLFGESKGATHRTVRWYFCNMLQPSCFKCDGLGGVFEICYYLALLWGRSDPLNVGGIPRLQDTRAPGHQDPRIPGLLEPWVPGP